MTVTRGNVVTAIARGLHDPDMDDYLQPELQAIADDAIGETIVAGRTHKEDVPLTLVENQVEYDAEPCFELTQVELGGQALDHVADGDEALQSWESDIPGVPDAYRQETGATLRINPKPRAGALGLIGTINRIPTVAGTGYAVGDILNVRSGGLGGQVKVKSLSAGGKTGEAFGDSIVRGFLATDPSLRMHELIEASAGWAITNSGENSMMLQATGRDHIFPVVVSVADNFILLSGYNDMRHWGSSSAGQDTYERSLRAALAWLAIPDDYKVRANDDEVTKTGTWIDTDLYDGNLAGVWSGTQGDTLEVTVYGTSIYIGYSNRAGFTGGNAGGTFTIHVNDDLKATIDESEGELDVKYEYDYWPEMYRVSGLQEQSQTVLITVTSATGKVNIDWFAGNHSYIAADAPRVFAGNTLSMTAAGYATAGDNWNNGSDAAVAAFNVINARVTAALLADGLNVYEVDTDAAYDPETMGSADPEVDIVHPGDDGHAALAAAYLAVINGLSTYPILELIMRDRSTRGTSYTTGAGKRTAADTGEGSGCTVEILSLAKLEVTGYSGVDEAAGDETEITAIPEHLIKRVVVPLGIAMALENRRTGTANLELARRKREESDGWVARMDSSLRGR